MQQFIVEPRHTGKLASVFPNSAPIFKPGGNGNINVKDDYMWALQKNALAREDVPNLFLREQTVEISSALQNLRYNIGNASPLIVASGTGSLLQRLASSASGGISIRGQLLSLGGAIGAGALTETLLRNTSLGDTVFGTGATKNYLKPYSGLYATKDTGFRYTLPYLEKEQIERLQTQWGDGNAFKGYSQKKNTVSDIVDSLNNISQVNEKLGTLLSNIAPSTYVEKPKTFQYGSAADQIKVKLYLFNTVEWKHVVNNFEFVTLLFYQNLPNRLTTIIVDTPVIYEAYIPGVFYSPFCYISDLQINSIGASRSMKMPMWVSTEISQRENIRTLGKHSGGVDKLDISTIIPDVYEIEFTLQSLVPKSKNLKFQSLMSSSNESGFSININNGV